MEQFEMCSSGLRSQARSTSCLHGDYHTPTTNRAPHAPPRARTAAPARRSGYQNACARARAWPRRSRVSGLRRSHAGDVARPQLVVVVAFPSRELVQRLWSPHAAEQLDTHADDATPRDRPDEHRRHDAAGDGRGLRRAQPPEGGAGARAMSRHRSRDAARVRGARPRKLRNPIAASASRKAREHAPCNQALAAVGERGGDEREPQQKSGRAARRRHGSRAASRGLGKRTGVGAEMGRQQLQSEVARRMRERSTRF